MRVKELEQVEKTLNESEIREGTIVQSIPDALFIVNDKGIIRKTNNKTQEIFGYIPEELIDQPIEIVIPEWSRDAHKGHRKEYNAHPTMREMGATLNISAKRKDGTEFTADVSLSPFNNNGDKYILCVVRDITGRKKSEEEVLKFSRAVEQSPVSVMITDTNGDIEYVNPKFERLTGYTLDEVKGQNPRFLNAGVSPKVCYKELWNLIKDGKEWRGEFHNRKKNGELFWEFASISPIFDGAGKITHYLGVKEDITGRKKIEEELRDYKEHLEKMVDDRTTELKRINKKLDRELIQRKKTAEELVITNTKLKSAQDRISTSEKLATIGKLAGVMAHEIRNPLGIISNSIYFLKMTLKKSMDEKVKKHLKILKTEIENADKIISDVLGFARIKTPILAERDINYLVKKTIPKLTIPKSIKVKTAFGKNLPKVFVDDTQMKQVFSNMILNAAQSMSNGGELKIVTNQVNGSLVVAFKDLGCGISEENLGKIFEPLFTTKAKGIGLGLTGCKSIVENHKGRIEIQSEVNKGTTVMVKLPAV
jgi:PAS domain S-box-containing protein